MPAMSGVRVIDPILTKVVQGYKHPEHVGFNLFPAVPVIVAGGKVLEFGRESWQLYNTERAPGTPYQRATFGHLGKPYALENHGLEIPVAREHRREAKNVPGIDMASRAIKINLRINALTIEKQQADLARNASLYGVNHKIVLSGTDQWSDDSSNPIKQNNEYREAVRIAIGIYPNVMAISANAFNWLQEHPKILEKIKYVQGGVVTEEILASVFQLQKVVVGKAIGYDKATDSHIDFWGKDIVYAYVPPDPQGHEEPSYGYTYTMTGHPHVEKPYWEDSTKSHVYGVGYERAPVHSGLSAGFLVQNAVE